VLAKQKRDQKRRIKAIFPEAAETEICMLAIHFIAQKPGLLFLAWDISSKN
jgi:hypothetical protein